MGRRETTPRSSRTPSPSASARIRLDAQAQRHPRATWRAALSARSRSAAIPAGRQRRILGSIGDRCAAPQVANRICRTASVGRRSDGGRLRKGTRRAPALTSGRYFEAEFERPVCLQVVAGLRFEPTKRQPLNVRLSLRRAQVLITISRIYPPCGGVASVKRVRPLQDTSFVFITVRLRTMPRRVEGPMAARSAPTRRAKSADPARRAARHR